MTVMQMTMEDLTNHSNVVKEQLLGALERDGLLRKPGGDLAGEYAVVIHKPGWLGSLFRRLKGSTENDLQVTVVKAV